MKKLPLLLALAPCFCMAQQAYIVKGNVAGLKPGEMVFMFTENDGKPTRDSIKAINGIFQFRGNVVEPERANIYVRLNGNKNTDAKYIYLEKGTISINSPSTLDKASVKGGPANNDLNAYNRLMSPYTEKFNKVYEQMKKASPQEQKSPGYLSSITVRLKKISEEHKHTSENYLKTHPNSYMPLERMHNYPINEKTYSYVDSIYKTFSPQQKATRKGQRINDRLLVIKNTKPGSTAPDFTLPDTSGRQIKLSSFRGKYVLLDFWASWCGPCRAENPNVVKAYNAYKNKNFAVVGISLDDEKSKNKWLAALRTDHLEWTQLCDLKGWSSKAALLYNIQSIPSNFLIDPQGKILEIDLRGEKLNAALAKYIQ